MKNKGCLNAELPELSAILLRDTSELSANLCIFCTSEHCFVPSKSKNIRPNKFCVQEYALAVEKNCKTVWIVTGIMSARIFLFFCFTGNSFCGVELPREMQARRKARLCLYSVKINSVAFTVYRGVITTTFVTCHCYCYCYCCHYCFYYYYHHISKHLCANANLCMCVRARLLGLHIMYMHGSFFEYVILFTGLLVKVWKISVELCLTGFRCFTKVMYCNIYDPFNLLSMQHEHENINTRIYTFRTKTLFCNLLAEILIILNIYELDSVYLTYKFSIQPG